MQRLSDVWRSTLRATGRCSSPTGTASRAAPPGRSAFITGQSVFRTGLSKVGIPGSPVGMRPEDPTIARSAEGAAATPPDSSARTTSATRTSTCRRCTASTSSSATSTTSTPRRSPSCPTTRRPRTSRSSESGSVPAASCTPGRTRTARSAIEDTGPLSKKRMETIDDEVADAAIDFIRRQHGGRHPVLHVGQHHPHALPHPRRSPRASARPGGGSRRTTTR